jgi:orotidine-5'-phosphate decarboxylase
LSWFVPPIDEERLIVALDVDHLEHVKHWFDSGARSGNVQVGKQFTCAGPQAVRLIQNRRGEFLDLKFHDIPHRRQGRCEATRRVKMFNVHASGSLEMMRDTVKEVRRICRQEKRRQPIMLAVTVLKA